MIDSKKIDIYRKYRRATVQGNLYILHEILTPGNRQNEKAAEEPSPPSCPPSK